MNHCDDELRQAVALFRYGLLADIVHLPPGTPGVGERLRDKARHTYVIPGTRRTRVAAETLRDWLALYRSGGFEALYAQRLHVGCRDRRTCVGLHLRPSRFVRRSPAMVWCGADDGHELSLWRPPSGVGADSGPIRSPNPAEPDILRCGRQRVSEVGSSGTAGAAGAKPLAAT